MKGLNSRREFLRKVSAAIAAPAIVPSSVFGAQAPGNRVNLAAIGVGGRGTYDTNAINRFPDARFLAVCDCYRSRREEKRQQWNQLYGGDYVKAYRDPWEVLARKDIDAVVIATPDHWHVPMALAAIRAGKDCYCEKPLSIAMQWSWRLRNEMKDKGRIFQYGTQQRSDRRFRYACELVRNGYIGQVQRVEVWCPDASQQWETFGGKPTLSVPRYGSVRPVPPPSDLEFDMWCGPSPQHPYTVDRCTPYGAYHIYDYSLGFIAGWGAHPLDIAQWGLGADNTSPVFYEGAGALPQFGLLDTVESWDVHCYYAGGVHMRLMDFRVAKPVVMQYRKRWSEHGTTFFGSEGWVSVDRQGIEVSKESLNDVKFRDNDVRLYESDSHHRNFIDCVKSRKPPVSPLETAIRSDTISHLSDIMIRLRRPIQWDPEKEAIVGDEQATKMLDRPMRAAWRI
jgi:predicted dehydrogenase